MVDAGPCWKRAFSSICSACDLEKNRKTKAVNSVLVTQNISLLNGSASTGRLMTQKIQQLFPEWVCWKNAKCFRHGGMYKPSLMQNSGTEEKKLWCRKRRMVSPLKSYMEEVQALKLVLRQRLFYRFIQKQLCHSRSAHRYILLRSQMLGRRRLCPASIRTSR